MSEVARQMAIKASKSRWKGIPKEKRSEIMRRVRSFGPQKDDKKLSTFRGN